jgi:hypothetical protein
MSGRKHQFSVPQVDHPGLAAQVRRQKTRHQRGKRAQIARFREQGLCSGLGREDPVEFGKAHGGSRTGRQ